MSAVCVVFLAVFASYKKKEFYTVSLTTYNCIVFTSFQHTKLSSFQNLSLGLILKILLKFGKFHPWYSYQTLCYKKQKCILFSRNLFSFVIERQATDLRVWFWEVSADLSTKTLVCKYSKWAAAENISFQLLTPNLWKTLPRGDNF